MAQRDDDAAWLAAARCPAELRTRLLGLGPRGRAVEQAVQLLQQHRRDRKGADATVRLLLTDRRWRHAADALAGQLEANGLLAASAADVLAGEVLSAPALTVRLPGRATSAELSAERPVPPLLHRWAGERAVLRGVSPAATVRARAASLPARAGAAVMCGVVRALGVLPPDEAEHELAAALRWPSGTVRAAALDHLRAQGAGHAAAALARDDPSRAVRRRYHDPVSRGDQAALF